MIHEVLFSLLNGGGALFKTVTEEQWLENPELRGFLHPGERELLRHVMEIGLLYHKIEKFRYNILNDKRTHVVLDSVEVIDDPENKLLSGLYLKAFCNGTDRVLRVYREEINSMEDQFLKNPDLTLSFVLGTIKEYKPLLEFLMQMIRTIRSEGLRGASLLGRLYSYLDSNIEFRVKATTSIIIAINTVFYRHLYMWIIYGELTDDYDEFFVCDAKCADEHFQYDETGEERSTSVFEAKPSKEKKRNYCPVRKFYVRHEMLPSFVCAEMAETVLFMGRIVWIIRNEPKSGSERANDGANSQRDIWEGNDSKFCKKIQELGNGPFNINGFRKTIEECRLTLTKYLWSVMVEEAKLLDHLQHVRDYYALGRGELFQYFITSARHLLKKPPNSYIMKNLNFIFTESATKMYGEYDRSFQKFELAIIKHSETCDNPWTRLKLNFDIVWPLHIIFYPKTLDLYNKLFRFLLTITRTQIELNKLWQTQMATKRKINKRVWTLRHELIFIVNNLQYYLQVDVIEAEFSVLKKAVQNANKFEDIIRLHSKFLSTLLSKTFVMTVDEDGNDAPNHSLIQMPSLNYGGKNMMYSIILLILELCNEFCAYAHTWEPELNELQSKELEGIENRAKTLTDMLLRFLYNIHQQVSGQHLLQLLNRLDFNRWYTKSKCI